MKVLALVLCAGAAVAASTGTQETDPFGCGPVIAEKKPADPPAERGPDCISNPDNWVPAQGRRGPTRIAEVERGVAAVRRKHPRLFNGDFIVGECHAGANAFFAALTQEIRAQGLCAWPGPDAIHPASTVSGIAEEYHLINYGGCRLWPASRNNYKGDWVIR